MEKEKKVKLLALIANHTYDNIKYNISINNLNLIKEYLDNVCIIDTLGLDYAVKLKEFFSDEKKINNIFLIENNEFFDFGKWIYGLNNVNYYDYDYIIFINDSIVFDLDIKKYFQYIINKLDRNINLFGYNDSTQVKFHYQSFLFTIHSRIVKNFIQFFESKKNSINCMASLIYNTELCLHEITSEHDSFLKLSKTYNCKKNLHWENEVVYKNLLLFGYYGIYKLKRIFEIQNKFKLIIHDKNSIINNFDYDFYKSYYDDTFNLTNEEMIQHYINIGQYEGRRYCYNFNNYLLPEHYRTKLKESGILYIFDIPDDFDLYYYRKNNESLINLTNIECIMDFIKVGIYENKVYNKTDCLKNYIQNIYDKFYNIKKNEIDTPEIFEISEISTPSTLLDNFDVNIYRYLNNDLNDLSDNELIEHYLNYGENEKRKCNIDYKKLDGFDIKYYKKYNQDLASLSDNDLIIHYLKYGIDENRKYKYDIEYEKENIIKNKDEKKNPLGAKKINNTNKNIIDNKNEEIENMVPTIFEPLLYLYHNPDLQLINKNNNGLLLHYLNNGIKEKRQYNLKISKHFNIKKYIDDNIELKNLSDIEVKLHYLKNNKSNIIPENNINNTKDINNKNNIKNKNDNKLSFLIKKHTNTKTNIEKNNIENNIQNNGLDKKIKKNYYLPNDIDIEIYKKLNKDLKNLNENELKEHYGTKGFYENRYYKIPDDFNAEMYRFLNSDLIKFSEDQLIEHFISTGIYERRLYKLPIEFSPEIYKKLNPDLKHLSDDESIQHYINHYSKETRKYKLPPDFDVDKYLKFNPDLKKFSENQLILHFLNNGIDEDRQYK